MGDVDYLLADITGVLECYADHNTRCDLIVEFLQKHLLVMHGFIPAELTHGHFWDVAEDVIRAWEVEQSSK